MRLIIAGGGTGGHLFPGLAIADEIRARGGQVIFVGTARGLEAKAVPAAGFPLEVLDITGLKRMGPIGTLRGLLRLPVAFAKSLQIVRRFAPDVVLGVGGYASGPLLLAAAFLRRPTAIQEQNTVPGLTNRHLGRLVRAVFGAFPEAAAAFPPGKFVLTGNPVRRRFLQTAELPSPTSPPRVLVVGGSQGARAVNDLVLGAVQILARSGKAPQIVHQAGPADADRVRAAYADHAIDAVTVHPFIEDMATAYAAADLVIARAGALTLAELSVVARPAILIPLPTATDNHQMRNAQSFADAGAALIVNQDSATPESLATAIADLMANAARRAGMAVAMYGLARPRAAQDIANRLEEMAG